MPWEKKCRSSRLGALSVVYSVQLSPREHRCDVTMKCVNRQYDTRANSLGRGEPRAKFSLAVFCIIFVLWGILSGGCPLDADHIDKKNCAQLFSD